MNGSIAKSFPIFANLLARRFALGRHTTEDAIRYTHFAALLQTGVAPEDVVLEFPLAGPGHKKLDTLVEGLPKSALEFKFDREIPSKTNLNKTQRAGAIFKDFQRLAKMRRELGAEAFFVYVAGHEMSVYFQNQHPKLWALMNRQTMAIPAAYIAAQKSTFRKALGADWQELSLRTLLATELPGGYSLRVWEVISR